MKRLFLRIAALGVLVVMGWIAIAQAQRGNDRATTAGDTELAEKTPPSEATPKPVLAANSGANPLRAAGRRAAASEAPPDMVMIDDGPSAVPSRAEKPVPKPSSDPFALPPGRVLAGGPPAAAEAVVKDDIPDASALSMPPARAAGNDNRYPQLTAPATARDRYAAVARETDRAATAPPADADTVEPAQLKADPQAAPANPSRPSALAPGKAAWPASPPLDNNAGPLAAAPRQTAPSGNESGEPAATTEGTGKPGGKHLEGPQSPQLTIQKSAPAEIQVGKPAIFRVTVRNTGTVPASGVEIHDQVPKGTRVVSTTPRSSRGVQGELVWTLGTVKPGEESTVEVQLMPLAEGEIGSVATVVFNADTSARTVATRPQLVLESSAPERVLIGEELTLSITVSNPGTGIATGVVLQERIPAGLQHAAGGDLEYEVGDLRPGESRKLDLTLVAKQPGQVTNILTVRGDGNLRAEDKRVLEVVAPQLDVVLEGPKKRYLEREATYQLSVRNPGTATAQQVELVAYLPAGLKFVNANNGGHYEEANRAVHWRLEELPVNETGTVQLVTMPVEPGQQSIKLQGTAQRGLKVEKEMPVSIEGIASVLFQVSDTVDPIEVGGETTFEVKVINQGSKAATNVRVVLLLPPELKLVAAEGPSRHQGEGNQVVFDGLARLAPKADAVYRVRVQGARSGDLRTRIQLMTDEMSSPVTKEESTRVFADE